MDGTGSSFGEFLQPEYWRKRQPDLHIADVNLVQNLTLLNFPLEQSATLPRRAVS